MKAKAEAEALEVERLAEIARVEAERVATQVAFHIIREPCNDVFITFY